MSGTVDPGSDVGTLELRLAQQASIVGSVVTGGPCDLIVRLFAFDEFDAGDAAEVELIAGQYEFSAVDAPAGFIVAVFTRGATEPLATTSVASRPSAEITAPTIDVSATCQSLGSP